jgi:hypothetical protein
MEPVTCASRAYRFSITGEVAFEQEIRSTLSASRNMRPAGEEPALPEVRNQG